VAELARSHHFFLADAGRGRFAALKKDIVAAYFIHSATWRSSRSFTAAS
jgi:hypothetical protein